MLARCEICNLSLALALALTLAVTLTLALTLVWPGVCLRLREGETCISPRLVCCRSMGFGILSLEAGMGMGMGMGFGFRS